MRAHVENTASQITLAVAAAVSILMIGSECPAQGVAVGDQLFVTIRNNCGDQIAAGELDLVLIPNGVESTISIRGIPAAQGTLVWFPNPLQGGRRYRVVYRADWPDDPSKRVYFKSKIFVFQPVANWIRLDVGPAHVVARGGDLRKIELNNNQNVPDPIFANPGDLIEFDYTAVNVGRNAMAPRGGAHPDVVDISPIGPRSILANGIPNGAACFFVAKSRGDDWVSIDVNGVPRRFHIVVQG
ncbi:MAG: hypothetical protein ACLQIB_33190 [Isosphaeraceae bacterium]